MDGVFRSSASARELGRRRTLALTTVVGVSGAIAVGGLMVGLVPADAGQAVRPAARPADDPLAPAGGHAPDRRQPPVATSGSS